MNDTITEALDNLWAYINQVGLGVLVHTRRGIMDDEDLILYALNYLYANLEDAFEDLFGEEDEEEDEEDNEENLFFS